MLDELPAAANLDSLIVEPLGEQGLTIVQCTRAPALATALSNLANAHGLPARSWSRASPTAAPRRAPCTRSTTAACGSTTPAARSASTPSA